MKNIKILLLLIPFLGCNVLNDTSEPANLQIYAKYINVGSDVVVQYTINGRGPFKIRSKITETCGMLELDTILDGLFSGDQIVFGVVGGNRINGNIGAANCPQSVTPFMFYSYDVKPGIQSISLVIDRLPLTPSSLWN